jgi:TPR repeat protein
MCYKNGEGVPNDYAQAVFWFSKASEHEHTEALLALGMAFGKGEGVAKDEVEAYAIFNLASVKDQAAREVRDLFEKALSQENRLLGQQRAAELLKLIEERRKAKEAKPTGIVMYLPDNLSANQSPTAMRQFEVNKVLAEKGDAKAQSNLGSYYEQGKGIPKDDVQAVFWFRKAAENGDALAQNNLGSFYGVGRVLPKDESKAVIWWRKAAEQGYALAQNNLGLCYYDGIGVPKDYAKAVFWYHKAAEQGNAEAQHNLGLCYAKGNGVQKDSAQAVFWFRKAAEQGNTLAQSSLGYHYVIGEGVLKDEIEAYALWNLAGVTDEYARKNRGIIEKQMSPNTRSLGQQRTKEWQKLIEERKKAKDAGK